MLGNTHGTQFIGCVMDAIYRSGSANLNNALSGNPVQRAKGVRVEWHLLKENSLKYQMVEF